MANGFVAVVALVVVFVAVCAVVVDAQIVNNAETEYFSDGNGLVAFYVYRVHNKIEMLANDNAASPGGEIGFLANEFQYMHGTIMRDCVVMYNQSFSSYDCCNGGSCGGCGYAGSANGPANMPGRSFQLYPPPGAPCNQVSCNGIPGVPCDGQCSGWWYSFQSQGACSPGQTPTAAGCTWYNSPVMQTIEFNDLLTSGKFFTCEQSNYQPSGGCNGYLAWQPFMEGVNELLSMFTTEAKTYVVDVATSTSTNVSVPAVAEPSLMCKAPCPPGSFSNSGYMSYNDQCQWCPVGTYNPYRAATSCQSCGGSTATVGSTSSAQCIQTVSPSSPTNNDGDADSDSDGNFLASDNAAGVKKTKSGLPSYAVVLIVGCGVLVAAAVGVAVVHGLRTRRYRVSEHVMMDLESSASAQ